MEEIQIAPGKLNFRELEQVYRGSPSVRFTPECYKQIDASRAAVVSLMERGATVYGLNTGFGLLANQRIPAADLSQLQLNLVRSHTAGVGSPLDDQIVRLILLLKAASLARGYSGVRREVIDCLLACMNKGALPVIPAQGSVGASGDLAPLAHMSLALIGEGQFRIDGRVVDAADGLQLLGIQPLKLTVKEGLALLNGTQVSTALAIAALLQVKRTFGAAIVAGALSVDAAMGSDTPFDPRIHQIRNHPAQIDCAAAYRTLLQGSEIRQSHIGCERVQDPYSLRCQPQVMGACLETLRHAAIVLLREANSVSDNPLVFADDHSILSGGNFHAEPVAIAADQMAIAISEIGALSERRLALLIDRHLSNLPPFLVEKGGLNSGFMIPQVTAAALATENKHLASAVSIDSLPTSANQEDHVSMATYAARRLLTMIENTDNMLAIELLAAAQGIHFRRPLRSSPSLENTLATIRAAVPHYQDDRPFHMDIAAVRNMIANGAITIDAMNFLHLD